MWEFNHILQTYNKTVTTLDNFTADSFVWSISEQGIQEKSRSGNFQNIIWLQNLDTLVGYSGGETLLLDYVYETPKGNDNYLFTENIKFRDSGAEIQFLLLLNGGFMDSRAFNVSLSADKSQITAQLGGNVFSCKISPERPSCRAFSRFDEVSNMMLIHSVESQKVIYFPNQNQLAIQMIWEWNNANMEFTKSTVWRETDETDLITWGFDERGGKQVDREGDFSSLFWSDSLGNSGTLDDELGPIIPIEEEEVEFT